jgi:hypothetical protein
MKPRVSNLVIAKFVLVVIQIVLLKMVLQQTRCKYQPKQLQRVVKLRCQW